MGRVEGKVSPHDPIEDLLAVGVTLLLMTVLFLWLYGCGPLIQVGPAKTPPPMGQIAPCPSLPPWPKLPEAVPVPCAGPAGQKGGDAHSEADKSARPLRVAGADPVLCFDGVGAASLRERLTLLYQAARDARCAAGEVSSCRQ